MTRYRLRIGPKDSDACMSYDFEMPKSIWEKWCKVSFQFKASDKTYNIAHSSIVPSRMIYVKERWYHRLTSWVYFKFKR